MVNKKAAQAEAVLEGVEVEFAPPPKRDAEKEEAIKSNRRYWDTLKDVTDTTALKGFTRGGGFTGTDINPTWRMERLTEVFGPIGWGWGYEIVKRWSETFNSKPVVYATVRCWYVPTDEKPVWAKDPETGAYDRRKPPMNALWTGEQDGGTEVSRTPDEAYKQAITDGFGKASMQIGLASAIYRGKWDDSKYKEDQERFSQIESVSKYLEVLVPELCEMTDTRELKGLFGRVSFNENKRIAAEVSFKLKNEFDAIVDEHVNRIVSDLWNRVRHALKLENLDALTVAIDALKPEISALPEKADYEEIKRLVVARKAELKTAEEKKEEAKEEAHPIEQPKVQATASQTKPTRKEEDEEIDYTKVIPVPHKDGTPRWGTFTKNLLSFIHAAKDKGVTPQALSDFYDNHNGQLENMASVHPDYAKRVRDEYFSMYIELGGAKKEIS
jgi:hypothetical protein